MLVVNPYITDFKLYDEWMHPTGLYMLIDLLTANGLDVCYFDCLERSETNSKKKYGTGGFTHREIKRPECFSSIRRKYKCYGCSEKTFRDYCGTLPSVSAIFVGSMMTYWVEGVIRTITILKELFPLVPIICGGIAVQLVPDFFRQRVPDIFLYTSALPAKGTSLSFPGINKPLYMPENSSLLPGLRKTSLHQHGPILASLGCPMRCSYCASALLQPHFLKRSYPLVVEELTEMVEHWTISDYAFYDDALLADADALLLPLLRHILHSKWRIRLHTPNGLHLKYVTEPLLALMRTAGFTTLRFGYESGTSGNRHYTGNKANTEMLLKKCSLINNYRFPDTGVYVMGGLPESTPDAMMEEMNIIAGGGMRVKPVFLSPVPGTSLFNYYLPDFPQLATDLHWHNDLFFITQLPGWGDDAVESIRTLARKLNSSSG